VREAWAAWNTRAEKASPGLKRIKRTDSLSARQEAALAHADRANVECEKTLGKVKK
jgi:hypothetical protein